jgi:chaperonin GroES|tara:strand:- start:1833 stop:2204 length:372 start_codon:yes stop_codon:yes gene_type:complete
MNNMSHQHENTLPVPLGWKVLIKPNEPKQKTQGGIVIPSKAQDAEEYLTAHGEVLAMGELAYRDRETGDKWKSRNWPKVGDFITYGKYAGQKLIVNGKKYLLLNDDEVTAILPDGVKITSYLD